MKNLLEKSSTTKCYSCTKIGNFCYTPDGADFYTCPYCGDYDFYHWTCYHDKLQFDKYFDEKNDGPEFHFCEKCKIVFDLGCVHAESGCCDSAYNGHVIGKWKYNDETHVGMPEFDSVDEWVAEIKNIEILEWKCLNKGLVCTSPYYSDEKYYGCTLKVKN